LIDGDATQEDAAQRHCPLCSLPTAIAVAAPASPQSPNDFSLPCVIGDDPVRLDVSLAGPPVGTRAPPTLS
jgi:hypothetical protein